MPRGLDGLARLWDAFNRHLSNASAHGSSIKGYPALLLVDTGDGLTFTIEDTGGNSVAIYGECLNVVRAGSGPLRVALDWNLNAGGTSITFTEDSSGSGRDPWIVSARVR